MISHVTYEDVLRLKDLKEQVQFSHLIFASEYNFKEMLEFTQNNLIGGGKLVVYSRHKVLLEELANVLFESEKFINIQLVDSFMR